MTDVEDVDSVEKRRMIRDIEDKQMCDILGARALSKIRTTPVESEGENE